MKNEKEKFFKIYYFMIFQIYTISYVFNFNERKRSRIINERDFFFQKLTSFHFNKVTVVIKSRGNFLSTSF